MLAVKLSIGAILTLSLLSVTLGQGLTYDERCQVQEGGGYRVDQCDGTKLLQCKDGRCQCADPANQIYTYRLEPISPSRSKRSPKKGGGGTFKKVAAGAVAGVATYHVAKTAGKALNNGFTTTERPPKFQKVFSCYSRAGGSCALNSNNWQVVEGTGSTAAPTSTTTVTPVANATTVGTNTTDDSTTAAPVNTSSSTAAPVASAQTALDISKLPRCVQFAVCKANSPSRSNSSTTGSFVQKVDFDPRVGVCECGDGYKRTTKDLCVKDTSGAGKTVGTSATLVILASLLFNKIFA